MAKTDITNELGEEKIPPLVFKLIADCKTLRSQVLSGF